ncbi:MAG: DUF3179 domain-containing (seleno)protein, partial [Bacteroidota bacterium]
SLSFMSLFNLKYDDMKNSKSITYLYWICTLFTVFWMYSGGVAALSNADFMVETIQKLGYPPYFHHLLGIAKLIGATLILFSLNKYLKAFAYAGVFYELISSSLSYALSGLLLEAIIPLLFFGIVGVSCYTWFRKNRYSLIKDLDLSIKTVKNFRPELVADKKFVKIYKTFQVERNNLIALKDFRKIIQRKEEREVFILNLNGVQIGITIWHLAYHHIAQGCINKQDFLITFCPVCNSGMVFKPVVNDQKLDFYVSGVYRGTMIMSDKQTNSYWDHITGECLHGFYGGEQLNIISSHEIIFEKDASSHLKVAVPKLSRFQKLVVKMQNGHTWRKVPEGKFYPGFKESFEFEDNRRPEKELGLGIVQDDIAKFYPLIYIQRQEKIIDIIGKRKVIVSIDDELSIPKAKFVNNDRKPTQIFMRWYGFVQTFKNVEIYEIKEEKT